MGDIYCYIQALVEVYFYLPLLNFLFKRIVNYFFLARLDYNTCLKIQWTKNMNKRLDTWQIILRILATVMAIDENIDPREHKEIFYSLEKWIKPGYEKHEKVLVFAEEIRLAKNEMGDSIDERVSYVQSLCRNHKTIILSKGVAANIALFTKRVIKADEKYLKSEKVIAEAIAKELADIKEKHDFIHGKKLDKLFE